MYKKQYITQSSDIFEMYAFYCKHFLYDEHALRCKKQLWGQWNDICGVIDFAPVSGCHSQQGVQNSREHVQKMCTAL